MRLRILSRLLSDTYPATAIVSWRGSEQLRLDRFRADVAAIAARFAGTTAAALLCQDSYHFAAGFYGLLHAGAQIILPPSAQPGALGDLRGTFTTLVDDAVIGATIAASANITDAALTPLDPASENINFFTSGSTGAPKRIVKSLGMFEQETAMFEQRFGQSLKCEARVFATVPHQHLYGLSFKLLWPLAYGRPFCAETHSFWETLLAELSPDAVIVSSPAHLSRLSGIAPRTNAIPACVLSSGAPLAQAASDEAATILGCRPTEIFGSTETGAIATRCDRRDENDPWHLLPGVAMHGADGHLSVRSPAAGPGWTEMSDLITPTADGFIYHGRTDRIVKIEGKRINLIAVEDALLRHPLVDTAAVITLTDPLRLAAAVVLKPAGRDLLAVQGAFRFARSLRKTLQQAIEPAGLPRQWRFIDALPTHPMGKRRQADIAALFGEST
ncbi:MAG: AMP-binding protein [Rhizomicrobium sp.]